ncbi:hypothetical protein IC582_003901 [Cucumis melo]
MIILCSIVNVKYEIIPIVLNARFKVFGPHNRRPLIGSFLASNSINSGHTNTFFSFLYFCFFILSSSPITFTFNLSLFCSFTESLMN